MSLPLHHVADVPHTGKRVPEQCPVVSVEVPAGQRAAVIPHHHTIRVQHRHHLQHITQNRVWWHCNTDDVLSHNKFDVPHLKNKSVPEQLSVRRVPEQKVQQPLHHPGAVGFPWVHSGRHHHSLLGPARHLSIPLGCYVHHVHGVPSEAVAQHPQFTVGRHCWVGGNPLKVALQVWVGVGVAVGQVAGVRVMRELESPGKREQGDGVAVVFIWILQRERLTLVFKRVAASMTVNTIS